MKKAYEKPVLTTEPFDAEDVVTASAPAPQLGAANAFWEVPDIPSDITFN